MSVLGAAAGLVDVRLPGHVLLAEARADLGPHLRDRIVGDAHRVGAHVGDEPHRLAHELDALVELLGHGHGAFHRESQLAGRLLLQGAGDEGRRCPPPLLAVLDRLDGEGRFPQGRGDAVGRLLVGDLELLALVLQQARLEGDLAVVGGVAEEGVDRPVLLGLEGGDLGIALADQAQGDGLHPPGGQAGVNDLPQEGADLVAHEAVEDAPGLLGVDLAQVEDAGPVDRLPHRLGRDLVEEDPLDLALLARDRLRHVPGDRLALAVGIRRQVDRVRPLRRSPEVGEDLALPADGHVAGHEVLVHVDAEFLRRQIADVPHARLHDEVAAEDLVDGRRLGRRLHDDE